MTKKYLWLTEGNPEDIHIFKTKKLVETWLKNKGYVKRGSNPDLWQDKEVEKGTMDEWDIWVMRSRVIDEVKGNEI